MTLASLTAEVVSGESVVPGCDATEVFAAAEYGLDAPAIPVAAVVVLDRTLAIAAAGDDRDRALLAQATPERHLLQPRTLAHGKSGRKSGLLDIIPRRILGSAAKERPFRSIGTKRRQGASRRQFNTVQMSAALADTPR
jgi:hypothetical protein